MQVKILVLYPQMFINNITVFMIVLKLVQNGKKDI